MQICEFARVFSRTYQKHARMWDAPVPASEEDDWQSITPNPRGVPDDFAVASGRSGRLRRPHVRKSQDIIRADMIVSRQFYERPYRDLISSFFIPAVHLTLAI